MPLLNERVKTIREKFKLEYLDIIELPTPGGIHSTCYLGGSLYLGRFEREGNEVKGRIESLALGTSKNLQSHVVLDGLVLKPGMAAFGSPLILCGIPGEKKLVFPAYEPDGRVILRKFDPENRQISNFEKVPDPGHLSIVDIKLVNDYIYILDMFSNSIKKYSLNGERVFDVPVPQGFAFPFSSVLMKDGNLLISFYQKMMKEKFPKYVGSENLNDDYFACYCCAENEFRSLRSEVIFDDYGNLAGHPGHDYIFLMKGDELIKMDDSLNVVYRAEFSRFLKDHFKIFDFTGKVNFSVNAFEKKVLIYNMYGIPQIIFQFSV